MQEINVMTCQMMAASGPQATINNDETVEAAFIEGKGRFDDDDEGSAWTNGLW